MLNNRFLHWGIFHEELAIDKAMVKYYGRYLSKQFTRGKPFLFRYKNWVLATSDGYCY